MLGINKQDVKRVIPDPLLKKYDSISRKLALPKAAKLQAAVDKRGLPETVPSVDECIEVCMEWLRRAQDESPSNDGGVARDFSLVRGWATSYPETTGYIVPTFIETPPDNPHHDEDRNRAQTMLNWLVDIQLTDGGYQGGLIDATPVVPTTFNTGQILIGLARGAGAFDNPRYHEAMDRAARFLRDSLDSDGCWRSHPSPFAAPGEKSYETHVSWGLFEAERINPGQGYGEAGLRQVEWALTKQNENGWFRDCCLTRPDTPLTHTIGYVLRGVIEAYLLSKDKKFLNAAIITANVLKERLRDDGYLNGRFDANWNEAASFVCLTGTCQIALCWLILYQQTQDSTYLTAATAANQYVQRTVDFGDDPNVRGAIRGAFPISGGYGRYEYLNWANKFFVDSLRMQQALEK